MGVSELMPRTSEQEWRWQISQSELPGITRAVAAVLALHMNPNGSGAEVGTRTLSKESGYSYNATAKALHLLEDEKWLLCLRRGGGSRGTLWAANIPPNIWDELALESPAEIMRRDLSTPVCDSPRGSLSDVATHPESRYHSKESTYPQPAFSDSPRESQTEIRDLAAISSDSPRASLNAFVSDLRAASDSLGESNLDLDLKKPTANSDLTTNSDLTDNPGGGESPPETISAETAPGYRDPDLWTEAGHIATQANPTNLAAYRQAVYKRLADEQRARQNMHTVMAAIETCDLCTVSGMVETDTGWIRCTHQGAS